VHAYMHAYIHTFILIYITYIYTYVHIHIPSYLHSYIHTYVRKYIHTTYIHTFIHTYMHVFFCVNICARAHLLQSLPNKWHFVLHLVNYCLCFYAACITSWQWNRQCHSYINLLVREMSQHSDNFAVIIIF